MEILHEEVFGIPENQSSSQLEVAANWGAEWGQCLQPTQPKPGRIPLRRKRIKEQKQRQVFRLLVKSPCPPWCVLSSVEPWVMGKVSSPLTAPGCLQVLELISEVAQPACSQRCPQRTCGLAQLVFPPFSPLPPQAWPCLSKERRGPLCLCAQANEKGWDSLGMSQGRLRNALFPGD